MKVMVAALPKTANSPNPHIRIERTSSKVSFIVQKKCNSHFPDIRDVPAG